MQVRRLSRIGAAAGVPVTRFFRSVPAQRRTFGQHHVKGLPERDRVDIIWTHRKVAIVCEGYHGCTLSPDEVFIRGLQPMDPDPGCLRLAEGPGQRLLEVLLDHAYGEDGGFENASREGRMFCHASPFVPTSRVFDSTLEFTDPYYHPKDSGRPPVRMVYEIDMASIVRSRGKVYCLNSEVPAPYPWEIEVVVLGPVSPQFIVRGFLMKRCGDDWQVEAEFCNPNYRPTVVPVPEPSRPATASSRV